MGKDMILFMVVWIVGVVVLLYFMTILPGKRKSKKIREMRDSIVPGDEIVTIGGIMGTVLERDEESLRVCIDDETGATMRIVVYAVQSIRAKYGEA